MKVKKWQNRRTSTHSQQNLFPQGRHLRIAYSLGISLMESIQGLVKNVGVSEDREIDIGARW